MRAVATAGRAGSGWVLSWIAVVILLLVVGGAILARQAYLVPVSTRLDRPAPGFTLPLFSGKQAVLDELRGRPVVLNFWASYNHPSRQEAPVLERAWQEYRARGVTFVGVAIHNHDRDAQAYVKRYKQTYLLGPDRSRRLAAEYGVSGIPETFFISSDGRIVRKHVGPLNDELLRLYLDELLTE